MQFIEPPGALIKESPSPRRRCQTARQVGIGLAIATSLMAGLEGVLRVVGFEYHRPPPIIIWNRAFDREMEGSRGMYRFHPYWFWELRPGSRVARCPDERINAAGYRGPERSPWPDPGMFRIVVLGDSTTFGLGVCWSETYAALLQRELRGVEVLNFGVEGFSAFQGEKLLEGRIVGYHPRVVVAVFGAVNEALPALGHDVDSKFTITSRANPLAVVWRDRLDDMRILQLMERLIGRRLERGIELKAHENWEKWNRGSRDYVRNQSVASFERSLERIVRSARSHDARVVLLSPPRRTIVETRWPWVNEYSAAIERVASRLNVPFWDVRAAFRAVPGADEKLFLDYYHPNAAGHQLYARFLAEKIINHLGYEPRVVDAR